MLMASKLGMPAYYVVVFLVGLLSGYVSTIDPVPEPDNVGFTYIHDGVALVSKRAAYSTKPGANFGSYRFWCLGDLAGCGTGFTMTFWIKPKYSPPSTPETVLITNGGHLPFSDGFYVKRRFGDQYEIGVSLRETTWKAILWLDNGSWTHITMSWKANDGLRVYVDGFPEAEVAPGSTRLFTNAGFDVANDVIVGEMSEDGQTLYDAHYDIENITIVNKVIDELAVEEEFGTSPRLFLGCEHGKVIWDNQTSVIQATTSGDIRCRERCHYMQRNTAHYDAEAQRCNCDHRDLTISLSQQCTGETWMTYVTSHVINGPRSIITISHTPYTGDWGNYQNDSIELTVEMSPPVDVPIEVDLDDGTIKEVSQGTFSHKWSNSGSYRIVASAIVGGKLIEGESAIWITPLVKDIPPEVITISPTHGANSRDVLFGIEVADKYNPTCDVTYGDQSASDTVSSSEYVSQMSASHQYTLQGQYECSVTCQNTVGNLKNTTNIIARTFELNYEYNPLGEDFNIPVFGSPEFLTHLATEISSDEETDPILSPLQDVTDGQITFTSDNYEMTKRYFTGVSDVSDSIVKYVVDVQQRVSPGVLNATEWSGVVNSNITITAVIPPGDKQFVTFSFGLEEQPDEFRLFENVENETTFEWNITYAELGFYPTIIVISNDVSSEVTSHFVSIEEPLVDIELYASEISDLSDHVVLTADVNIDGAPPQRVTFDIDYGDGRNTTVIYNNPGLDRFVPFEHEIQYQYWGIYQVNVTARNEISAVNSSTEAQAGQDITEVYLTVSSDRIPFGDPVIFEVFYPNGSDVTFDYSFGDGSQFLINEVDFREVVTGREVTKRHGRSEPLVAANVGSVIMYKADSDRILVENIPHMLTVTYHYSTPGLFDPTVEVSNMFGQVSTNLCPTVVVSANTQEVPACSISSVNFNNVAVGGTIERRRSDEISMRAIVDHNCGNGANHTTYTWKANRITIVNGLVITERPFPPVCEFMDYNDTFVIPALSFPVGWYKVYVTVSPDMSDLATTSESFTVRILPSPPLAIMEGGEEQKVYVYGSTSINITNSRDPDIELPGTEALTFDFFCAAYENKDKIDEKDQNTLIHYSTIISYGQLYENYTQNPTAIYDCGGCFLDEEIDIFFDDDAIRFQTSSLAVEASESEAFYFLLIVCKDGRCSRSSQNVTIRSSDDNSEYDRLDELLLSGDTGTVLNIVSLLSADLNSAETDNKAGKTDKTKKRGKLIDALTTVSANITSIDQVEKTTAALASVTESQEEVSQDGREIASQAMNNIAKAMEKTVQSQPVEKVAEVGGGLLGALGNLLPADKSKTKFKQYERKKAKEKEKEEKEKEKNRVRRSTDKKDSPDSENEIDFDALFGESEDTKMKKKIKKDVLDGDNPSIENDVYAELLDFYADDLETYAILVDENEPDDILEEILPPLRAQKALDDEREMEADKSVAASGSNTVNDISKLVMNKLDNNASISMTSDKIKVALKKLDTNVSDNDLPQSDEEFKLPSSVVGNAAKGNSSVGLKMVGTKVNQFTWGEGADSITGETVSLSLTDDTGGELEVKDSEPISIWIPTGITEATPSINTIIVGPDTTEMNFHTIHIPKPGLKLHVEIRPENDGDSMTIIVKKFHFPNESYYDYKETLPKSWPGLDDREEEMRERLRYTSILPLDITENPGIYRVGVKVQGTMIDLESKNTSRNYTLQMYTSGCRYRNEVKETWDTNGCESGIRSSILKTHCLCTHLTAFGGSMVVPPNTIDFNTVWAKFANLNENAAVFSTVIVIMGIYVISLFWARREDKKDVIKWGAFPLDDNLPTDNYHYQLSIQTGIRKGAETKSKLSFVLSGDDSDSGVRRLYDGKRELLERGSIMNYILSVETTLGSLNFLRIWHDNSGRGKFRSWFMEQLQVVDLQTGQKYFFLCDKWLAVEEGDGLVERVLPVAGLQDLVNFSHLFSSSARKKLSNEHLWFSIFSRPTRSHFTRVQRISCCMSLLFLTMITNAMWFKSEERIEDASALRIGPFSFTLQAVFISFMGTMIVFPVNFLLITIFRRCRPLRNNVMQSNQQIPKRSQKHKWRNISQAAAHLGPVQQKSRAKKFKESIQSLLSLHKKAKYSQDVKHMADDEGKPKKKKAWSFPHWMLYIAYILCFFSIVSSGFFTILYSMEWGAEKANEWLLTFLLSFFQSVIVVQPFKVLLIVAFIACILKKPDIGEDDMVDDEPLINDDEEAYKEKDQSAITAIMLQRKTATQELAPPDPVSLEAARELRLKEVKMESILKEIIIYTLFVLTLFFVSYQTRDDDSFFLTDNLRNIFLKTNKGVAFSGITTIPGYWSWMETVLLPSLYASRHFNNSGLKWWDRRCIEDMESRRVGIGRIRQMRIKANSCDITSSFSEMINHCRAEYSWTDDDSKTYYPKWQPIDGNVTEEEMKTTPWDYRNSLQLKNAPYAGSVTVYKGGGYVANFRRSMSQTVKVLADLKEKNWIDLKTRAVFVEFTLYNPNVNLFTSVILLVEFLATGGAFTKSEFKVMRLFSYIGPFGIVVVLFELIFVGFTTYFLVHAVKKIRKGRRKYFQNFWNMLEFLLLVFSLTVIAMYAVKHILTNTCINAVHEAGTAEFVNFQSLALYDEYYAYMVGVVVFLATIQFLKLLQFNKHVGVMGDTLKLAYKDLKMFGFLFVVYFLTFCMIAYLLFGKTLAAYGNIVSTMETLFAFILGDFDFASMEAEQKILGPIFFFLYVIIVYIALMGIFLTIIAEAFAEVKANASLRANEYEIVDFMMSRLKGILGVK